MHFTVSCPSCQTEFPVDSLKVPEGGIHAICSACERIFLVERPLEAEGADEEDTLVEAEEAEAEELGEAEAEELEEAEAEELEEAEAEELPEAEAIEEVAEGEGPGAQEEQDEEEAAPVRTAPRFGHQDPDEKAARLARVLVQDMIAYNKPLYEKALERGTLKEDFEEEVRKSWEEYVDRIGREMATSTTYFRDALNDILAQGEALFDGPP